MKSFINIQVQKMMYIDKPGKSEYCKSEKIYGKGLIFWILLKEKDGEVEWLPWLLRPRRLEQLH